MTAILVVLLALFLFIPAPNRNGQNPQIETNSENIRVFNLLANQKISSPLVVLGEARLWYFEASFPARLEDGNGKIITQVPAQAKTDWMTKEFVPFEARFEFTFPETQTGYVILEEDDPSGLNQNREFIKIPIVFENYIQETSEVKIFFSNSNLDPEVTCAKVFPVTRKIAKTEAVGKVALEALIKGPVQGEVVDGYQTNLNQGIKVNSLKIQNGLAEADFSEELETTGGSCRVSAIRSQITETLKQFPTVNEVKISINGRSEDILQP